MRVRLCDTRLERVDADLLALLVMSEGVPALRREPVAGKPVVAELERRRFTGAEGASLLVRPADGARKRSLAIVGLGAGTSSRADAMRRAADQVVARAREARARRVAVRFVGARGATPAWADAEGLGAFVEGAMLASYAFTDYRRDPERVPLATLLLTGLETPGARAVRDAVRTAAILADATNRARTWINRPAAVLTPRALADEAEQAARAADLEVRIDGPRAIARLEMGALLGVARGSAEPPRFIRLTYRPAARRGRPSGAAVGGHLALVGKAITFDSGGLSLKRPEGMEHMKRDMAGGAAVIAAMTAIAALEPSIEVRAYVPASENMPGGGAIKPGDVVRTVGGRTVEVVNTDAEGRLVLADALGIAVREGARTIVDVATLTGAIRNALGTRVAGILGNDGGTVRALIDAGTRGGERLWELPLVAAYRPDLESPVADLRNIAPDPHGGAIHAALFLEHFVDGRPWAHLDIAGVAFTERDLPCAPRGAVGFGVRLLTRYVMTAARQAAEGAAS